MCFVLEYGVLSTNPRLDAAVFSVYGMKKNEDILAFLLALNLDLVKKEASGKSISGPGLPPIVKDSTKFVTNDYVRSQLLQGNVSLPGSRTRRIWLPMFGRADLPSPAVIFAWILTVTRIAACGLCRYRGTPDGNVS